MKKKAGNTTRLIISFFSIILFFGCEKEIIDYEINIIPVPQELIKKKGSFKFNKNTKIIVDSDNKKVVDVANYFVEQFNMASGYTLKVSVNSKKKETKNSILFTDKYSDLILGDEGYTLVSAKNSTVLTGTPQGLFYAVQTLFQLLPEEVFSSKMVNNVNWAIPLVNIKDTPRFKWRGMHLDVGRHMFPVPFIKKYIDYIAMHKLNTFHWHLTEDQGWRIEIKKYPRLTEIGSQRKGSQIPKSHDIDNKPYGGFYTQNEIREVVAYAEERFVTVVPEIELPGHSVAALTAYPELSCIGGPFEVRTSWGVSDDIYCAGNEEVFTYIEDVLTEVLELFPSKYIHIGGDEAPKLRWKKCTKCQQRIKDEGLKDEHELQNYFISRIEKFLNSKGRQIIGWDEILEGGLAPNAAVMSWRGVDGGIAAAKLKHQVVMTPGDYLYFCWYAGKSENEPPALGGFLPLEMVYDYEPIPKELKVEEQQYIMGVQACLWTENIDTPKLAEYMLLPRLCALSEVAWSPKEKRNLDDFMGRMNTHYKRLDELEVNYRWPSLEGFENENIFIDNTKVMLISNRTETEIYYTDDGTIPTKKSKKYNNPFDISETKTINIIEFSPNGKSPIYKVQYIKQTPIENVIVEDGKAGLEYEYFEFKKPINSTNDLSSLKPVKKGVVNKFNYPFENDKLPEQFGLIYKGYIKIETDGLHTFSVKSNDGSRLYISDQLVVNNDGSHGTREREGKIALKAGYHKLQLYYFQAGGGKDLKVFIKGEGLEKIEIGVNLLNH